MCISEGMTGSLAVSIAACLNSNNKDHVSTTRLNTITTLKRMCEHKLGERKKNGDLTNISVPVFVAGVQADLRTYGLTLKKVYGYMEDQVRLYTYLAIGLHDETIKAIQDMYNE